MRWRVLCLCLIGLATSACSTLLQSVGRTVADEATAGSGPPRPTGAAASLTDASPKDGAPADPATLRPAKEASNPTGRESGATTASTYESTPMLGLSTRSFMRPYSLMESLVPRPSTNPGCRVGAQKTGDVLYAPEGTPVDASGPLGLRVARRGVPLHQFFTLDTELRSARAFHSGAVLAGEGAVCGRSFAYYYLELSLGWSPTPPVAVSR
jgi:hypothetical protein